MLLFYLAVSLSNNALFSDVGKPDGPICVDYVKSAVGQSIALAYALTVHKSQGSEYQVNYCSLDHNI